MSIHTQVLSQDRELAEKIVRGFKFCLDRADKEIQKGNIDLADFWVGEYLRCKRDLDKLIEKKKQHDKYQDLVNKLSSKGVNIGIILRKVK